MFTTTYRGYLIEYRQDKFYATLLGRRMGFYSLDTARRMIHRAIKLNKWEVQ